MDLTRIIFSVLVAGLLVVTGGGKVLRLPFSRGGAKQLGLSLTFWSITGALELAAAAGLVWGIWFIPFGITAAVGVVALMIGAIVFRFRSGSEPARRGAVSDVILGAIAIGIIVLSVLVLAA
jgi:hypothetical protein